MSKKTTTSGEAATAAAEAQAKRNRTRAIMIIAVFAVVVVAGVAVWAAKRPQSNPSAAMPAGVNSDGGVPVGTATSPIVDVYEDFQCPICKGFEDNVAPTLDQMVEAGQIKEIYHMMSFLDINLRNDSSKRAANAAGCAQDQGMFFEYHNEVFANQPATEGVGYTDDQLNQFAETVGIPDMNRFKQCVADDTFGNWVTQMEINSENSQVTGTPSLFVNGTRVDWSQASTWNGVLTAIQEAIAAAQ
jgi:protein-disulfide isomerase